MRPDTTAPPPPDTDLLHAWAQALRRTAASLDDEAHALRHMVDTVPWQGRAADAARGEGRRLAAQLAGAADAHLAAAAALEVHALAVGAAAAEAAA
ncbi:hypothetical protein [Nocardioides acrostichi]|uniref:Uncharacterized protein n=1 Tax=Nocardioides acrostichi TaxID=2784339 RepID=A0A930V5G6_9ACTN|nr:hypothetical protein [Nocardioides acrostichi]MBF4163534.1 hypothetical protein [Nocardioides acrostichi]